MSRTLKHDKEIHNLFCSKQILALAELKEAMGTTSTMAVFRLLSRLGYLSSYSHRGGFYTLDGIPDFDLLGLWACRSVLFSRHGNLLDTVACLVERSDSGYAASELDLILQVETKHALLQLARRGKIVRSKFEGNYIYMSMDAETRRRQELMRRKKAAYKEVGSGLENDLLPDEMRAAIILFYCLLDEKQRRLYAGLESSKLGHGGDQKIALLLGLDVHTVSKGRRELIEGSVSHDRVRSEGGGRKRVEKKALT